LDKFLSICICGFPLSNNLIHLYSFLGDTITSHSYFPYRITSLSVAKAAADHTLFFLDVFLIFCTFTVCLNGPVYILTVLFSTRYPVPNHI